MYVKIEAKNRKYKGEELKYFNPNMVFAFILPFPVSF
jgi:hypothetical protein